MSANNWTTCPQCKLKEAEDRQRKIDKAVKFYGKVSADVYAGLLEESLVKTELEDTLREDYELGIDAEFGFYVSYHCSCTRCVFEFRYKHEQKVKPK